MSVEVLGRRAAARPDYFAHPANESLFEVLALEWPGHDNPMEIVARTQYLAKGDHRDPAVAVPLTSEQDGHVREYCKQLGMTDARLAQSGRYDGLIILGGLVDSNIARVEDLPNQLSLADVALKPGAPVVVWGGGRPPIEHELKRIATLQEPLKSAEAHLPTDPRVLREAIENPVETVDETRQLALALRQQFGALMLHQISLRLVDARPNPPIRDFVLRTEDFDHDIVLQDARPVSRVHGQPRHTTGSSAIEWLEGRHSPQGDEPSKVLFVANNPYLDRTILDVEQAIANRERPITIVGCGSVLQDLPTRLLLGEWARRSYAEAEALKRNATN